MGNCGGGKERRKDDVACTVSCLNTIILFLSHVLVNFAPMFSFPTVPLNIFDRWSVGGMKTNNLNFNGQAILIFIPHPFVRGEKEIGISCKCFILKTLLIHYSNIFTMAHRYKLY